MRRNNEKDNMLILFLKKTKNKTLYYVSFFLLPIYFLINYIKYKLKNINIISDEKTVDLIVNEKKSLSRYGDGEFSLIFKKNYSIGFQNCHPELNKKLFDVLTNDDNKNLLIGIPGSINPKRTLKCTIKVMAFWNNYIFWHFRKPNKYLSSKRIYSDSLITRCYMDYNKKNKKITDRRYENLKRIWNCKDVVVIEGEKTKLGIGNDLLDNANSVVRIICPSKNAFSQYEEILKTAESICKNKIALIALGPTATVLAYDLSKMNNEGSFYQAIDIGHIDVEYEWFKSKAKDKMALKGKSVNEVKTEDLSNESINEEQYLNQIIKIIK